MAVPDDIAEAINRIGRDAEMPSIIEMANRYTLLQEREPYVGLDVVRDLFYGPDERHRLDVFRAADQVGEPKPVFIFVHGGGFIGGDKSMPGAPFYDNVCVWAARSGLIGVNITHRLAPQHPWPGGAEDLSAAVDWVKANIAAHGGDPERVFVSGTSAGAVHVASYLSGPYGAADKVAGAILLACLFDMPTCVRDHYFLAYFGEDESRYAEQSTLKGMAETTVPVLLAVAEYDPIDYERQALLYVNAFWEKQGRLPNLIRLMVHNHFTLAFHLNTGDAYLGEQMLEFIRRA